MVVRSKAPLRLGLAGGGTDLASYYEKYGGYVLNVTINMYAHCTIETIDNEVIFEAKDIEVVERHDLSSCVNSNNKLRLHAGVYNRIIKDFNDNKAIGVKVVTYSDAPPGSGLGSSSTMVVAIIKAYVELLNLPLGEYDIAKLAYDIERKDLGLSGGKQDQYAATFGGFNFMEFYKDDKVIVNPLRIRKWLKHELEESLVLFYTGQSRDSAKIIDEQVKQTSSDNIDKHNAMHEIKDSALRMKESLLRGDIKGLAAELTKGWEAKKKSASVVSNSKIDSIYDAAIGAGALAGKVSGAGGGGFMMFIVDPICKLDVIRKLKEFDGNVMEAQFVDSGTNGWYV